MNFIHRIREREGKDGQWSDTDVVITIIDIDVSIIDIDIDPQWLVDFRVVFHPIPVVVAYSQECS